MSSSASGTMAEGSRRAKPDSRSTGAEGSRQTVRYARTTELVSLQGREAVGGLTQLTPYIVRKAITLGRELYGLRHLRVERDRAGHRAGERRARRAAVGARVPDLPRGLVHAGHVVRALPRRDAQGRGDRPAGPRRRTGPDAGRRPQPAQPAAGPGPPAPLRHRPRRRAPPALRPSGRPGARAAEAAGRDSSVPGGDP